MSVQYHFSLRKKQKDLFNRSLDLKTLKNESKSLLDNYSINPEESFIAQVGFYQETLDKLTQYYNENIYQKKSWWQTFLYFIGWVSKEESDFLAIVKEAKHHLHSAKQNQNPLAWYDKVIWYFIEGMFKNALFSEDNHTSLRYLSHRTLLNVANVPEYLEGTLSIHTYNDYCQDLQHYIETIPTSNHTRARIENIILQFQRCHEAEQKQLFNRGQQAVFESLGRTYNIEAQSLVDTVFEIRDSIVDLKKGETALFAHGFTSKDGSHATVFEVEKTSSSEVRFRFYNTGAGSINTASWATILTQQFIHQSTSPVKVTDPISIESLLHSDFIEKLVKPSIIAADTVSDGIQQMNEPLLKLYHENKLHDDVKKIRHQLMGSCGQSCLDAWVTTQLNDSEFIYFYCHRLKQSLGKIEQLLANTELTEEEIEYCRKMRVAAKVELAFFNGKLMEISEQTKSETNHAFAQLQIARKENALSKEKMPKHIDLTSLDAYCHKKLSEKRLKSKFSVAQQQDILLVNSDSKINILSRKKEESKVSQFTLGIFGETTYHPLSASERSQNKFAKTKLCQKIVNLKQKQKISEQLSSLSWFTDHNDSDIIAVENLVDKRHRNDKLNYSDLTVR